MKYKLINRTTSEEHLCDKVTIDGFDYYVSDEKPKDGELCLTPIDNIQTFLEGYNFVDSKRVIAATNPNINVPKLIDEVEEITKDEGYSNSFRIGFKYGYNKSQETHPNSDEDMIEFKIWCDNNTSYNWTNLRYKSTKELLQLWKEQQPKIIYYND